MERRTIVVQGIVQGVGFRPFVHGLALLYGLRGFVRNGTGGVFIEVEGDVESLDRFLAALARDPPPLARIDHVSCERRRTRGDALFRIELSETHATDRVFISPDAATCDDCLAECFDPADRRFGYPFLNCTNCGPRLTIITGAPYDRDRTTMADFAMCTACRAEYVNPNDRRFHAQATACPVCGPRLRLMNARGEPLEIEDPLAAFAATLLGGGIGALKGLGGYHFVCDARNEATVRELRRRKGRDEKPFAVMVRDIAAASGVCEIDKAEKRLLLSQSRPIVLLRRRSSAEIAESVAPLNPFVGILLPYTPLHHLLVRAVGGISLVMTSGNRADEPIAFEDQDALRRLAGLADLFLTHDRPIRVRCEDSVTRSVAGRELPIRRSRGYAPQPIDLPFECPRTILAVGGQLKATFAFGRGRQAFLSHHLGDLDHYGAYQAFERDIDLYQQLFSIGPAQIVHDMHPDYSSTRYALGREAREGIGRSSVQHHHAHVASCMAENRLAEPVIGVAFDGAGYGTDGAIWGGEFFIGDYRGFRRAAQLRYVGMPGGEQAVREPWRMALAHLVDAECDIAIAPLAARVSPIALRAVETMLERRLNTPLTSSAGRLFDAAASMIGARDRVSHEGQAAMELEWLAGGLAANGAYPFDLVETVERDGVEPLISIDTRPLIRAVAREVDRGINSGVIARRFHSTMSELIAAVCIRLQSATGLEAVVLSGGVFLNALLTEEVEGRLTAEGFRVYRHCLVPPNDGGISLGQLAIAACRSALDRGVG